MWEGGGDKRERTQIERCWATAAAFEFLTGTETGTGSKSDKSPTLMMMFFFLPFFGCTFFFFWLGCRLVLGCASTHIVAAEYSGGKAAYQNKK